MTLATQVAAAIDPAFINLVQQAMVQQAIAIANEPANTLNHANRAAMARQILSSPASFAPTFAQGVASQGLDKTATDAALLNAVAAIWQAYSG